MSDYLARRSKARAKLQAGLAARDKAIRKQQRLAQREQQRQQQRATRYLSQRVKNLLKSTGQRKISFRPNSNLFNRKMPASGAIKFGEYLKNKRGFRR